LKWSTTRPVLSKGRVISSWVRKAVREVEVAWVDDWAMRMLPSALTKSTRMLGVRLGPRPVIWCQFQEAYPKSSAGFRTLDLVREEQKVVVVPLAETEE
jgi:hypothetical protein